jgi:hypothetical protein
MIYCQGPKCHEHRTKDRIKGSKGNKHYETRKRSSFYYGKSNFCSLGCQDEWFNKFGDMAINHFGRVHEPKRVGCDSAWYKDYKWVRQDSNRTVYNHYFVNDLLGKRITITEQQYNNPDLTTPSTS